MPADGRKRRWRQASQHSTLQRNLPTNPPMFPTALCGAPLLPHRPDGMAKSPSSRLSASIKTGTVMVAFLKARAIPGVEVVSNHRYARTILEIAGVHGLVAVEPTSGASGRDAILTVVGAADASSLRVCGACLIAADPQAVNAQLGEASRSSPLCGRRDQACGYQARGTGRVELAVRACTRSANHGGRGTCSCDARPRGAGRQQPEHGGADPCLSSS